ncbi:MAG: hypothetical protein AB8G26_11270 [Ilumatobacter sp.]
MKSRADGLWFAICALVHLAVATRLTDGLARTQFDNAAFAHFFDYQAEALLRGDLAVEEGAIGLEAFFIDDAEHLYFGLWPSLLRVPVLAVTDAFFGELTILSSFLAWALFVVAAWSLTDRAGSSLDGSIDPRLTRVWKVTLALGTPMLALAGTAWVFNEAIMWGVASCVWFQDRLVAELRSSSFRNQAWLASALVLAVLNRPTLGLGCVVVTLVVGCWRVTRERSWRGGSLAGLAAASAVLLVTPNLLRFGRLLGPPMERQGLSMFDEHRMRMLGYTGGDYVDPRFGPTNLLAYLRPDGIGLSSRFPFTEPPGSIPTRIGDVVHDITYRTPSLTASAPLLVGLAVLGLVVIVRSRRGGDPAVWPLVVAAAAGAPAAAALFVWGFIAPRYLADFVPLALPLGIVGVAAISRSVARADATRGRLIQTMLVALAAWSVIASVGIALTLSYQRGYDGDIAEYVSLRGDDPWTGAARLADPTAFEFDRDAPPAAGSIAVLGQCEASYFSTGEQVDPWLLLDVGPNEFRRVYEVRVDADAPDGGVDLARFASVEPAGPDEPDVFTVRLVVEQGVVRVDLIDRFGFVPYVVDGVAPGDSFELTVTSDPVRKVLTFERDGTAFGFGHVFTRSLYGPSGQTTSFASGATLDGVRVDVVPLAAPC